jgi:uncharacterized protein (DUF924 family)
VLESNSESTEVLNFWFGEDCNNPDWKADNRRWYSGGDSFDFSIRERFARLVERALAGDLANWERSPGSVMALIILLDQFTRNIFRGSPRAFEGDERARSVLNTALKKGFDLALSYKERCFIYMPLEHSESLADQQRCVELFEALLAEAPAAYHANIGSSLNFAIKHRDIIGEFGRFPHRNEILGRLATPGEIRYLADGGARFGQ